MRVLLVEDSIDIGQLVKAGLRPYQVEQVHSLSEANAALERNDFDVILLDIGLPDGNGFEFCMQLSSDPKFQNLLKIVLTGLSKELEVAYGFQCGADDYLTKPFSPIELKARIDRYFRKATAQTYSFGEFYFDLGFQKCFIVNGDEKTDLNFTPTEFRVFLILVKGKDRAFSRSQLERMVWRSSQTFIKPRGIDSHIAHMRKKLGSRKEMIVSVYGKGYAFVPEGSQG